MRPRQTSRGELMPVLHAAMQVIINTGGDLIVRPGFLEHSVLESSEPHLLASWPSK